MVFTNHESRNTNHGFFSNHGFSRVLRPSGGEKCRLGASRAEEKGVSRLARAGVLEQYIEQGKQAQRMRT